MALKLLNPVDMSRRKKLLAGCLFALTLGLAFPPFRTGFFAFFAFLPLFALFESTEDHGEVFRFSFLGFLIFNLVTLYWPGGFVHGKDVYLMIAGGILLLAHPLFYLLPVWLFVHSRRSFGFTKALLLFPCFWVAFEYLHSLTQVAFPWLLLAYTQSYDLPAIQYSSYTGAYGISFWILLINALLYLLYSNLNRRKWKFDNWRAPLAAAVVIVLYLLPKIYGHEAVKNYTTAQSTYLRIGVIQPDIDPFEKWDGQPEPQLSILHGLTDEIAGQHPDLILWPETAVPYFLLEPRYAVQYAAVKRHIDSLGVVLLLGVPEIIHYPAELTAQPGSKLLPDGTYYQTFNACMLIVPRADEIQKYEKMRLVPFAERVPFSEVLGFLNAAKWNFGLGGWNVGTNPTVFRFRTSGGTETRFSSMICYESIFPGFVARFVREGAEFLTILTNDSWWGNTSGPYQHIQIAVLRAVENHRWIVQCSNGGISAFIDPTGNIHQGTAMFTRATAISDIRTSTELTFYTRHGDWFAEGCLVVSIVVILRMTWIYVYSKIKRMHV